MYGVTYKKHRPVVRERPGPIEHPLTRLAGHDAFSLVQHKGLQALRGSVHVIHDGCRSS